MTVLKVRHLVAGVLLAALAGCAVAPFEKGEPTAPEPARRQGGAGPVVSSSPEIKPPSSESPVSIDVPPPPQLPKERPRVPPPTLSPASKALVSQASAQRKKGDLPGAALSLERALRIEPNNPLLWIEMGRLRMDQRNYPQAENMGRKALSMSVGDPRTQSSAWTLIADSLKARGRNPEAHEATERAKALAET
jgi:predicted Zn-dependent protease